MNNSVLSHARPAIVGMALFTIGLGLGYPLAVTGVSRLAFPDQSRGELLRDPAGHVIGSRLIAQGFAATQYLHARPSAAGSGYDPLNSGGSNLGPMDPKLTDRVKHDSAAIRALDGDRAVTPDAVTTSGSGLDPEISPANARAQAPRIAVRRRASPAEVLAIIDAHVHEPFLGFIGEPTVNVLEVNLALDSALPVAHPKT